MSKTFTHLQFLAKGKRGIIHTAFFNNTKVAIKKKLPESKAVGRIKNEATWLKELNKHNIGPILVKTGKDYFAYKFVEGPFLPEYLDHCTKTQAINILKTVLEQCFKLDRLKIDKEEMHRPYKHIIIQNNKPVMIDFERTHKTDKPKNVTQFCQYLCTDIIRNKLKKLGIKYQINTVRSLAKQYKSTYKRADLVSIKKLL